MLCKKEMRKGCFSLLMSIAAIPTKGQSFKKPSNGRGTSAKKTFLHSQSHRVQTGSVITISNPATQEMAKTYQEIG